MMMVKMMMISNFSFYLQLNLRLKIFIWFFIYYGLFIEYVPQYTT